MTPEQFCYWLQGFIELSGEGAALSKQQTDMLREHLALVFKKVTPPLAPAAQPQVIALPYVQPRETPDWLTRPTITCSETPGGTSSIVQFC